MNIEIQQILTHMVGFLITLWILKRYAWKPMLNLLDERRQKIADEFASIEAKKQETEALLREYEDRLRKIEDEARTRLNAAVVEGQQVAAQIKADAQGEARRITARAKDELARDVERARAQLKEDMVNMTVGATEMLLREKLDARAHRKMIDRFLTEVESLA
jgi:F-type H+-transporting ATPase subunit b